MAQNVIVGLIVALAVLYVLWRYMPQRWRKGLARVHPKLTQAPGCGSSSDGDGGCSSCGSCATGAGGGAASQSTEKPIAMPPSRH
ncbi:MAG: hypothetical protein EOO33_17870 [Comamonadaceae bacterium]|nr:MAG: hypothetical protein EOO33_17870 [Comamonadaceae bacterium]